MPYLALSFILWAALTATYALFLPPVPQDETRYLTVAWEMRQSGDWLLPHLNFLPYAHKPPLLFWMINGVWSFAGESVWSARLLTGAITLLVVTLTVVFARVLYPRHERFQNAVPLLLLTSPIFIIYGGLIMFDMLMTVFMLAGAIALWRAVMQGGQRWWALFGIALGFGVLAKGPVAFLHALFPVLLIPFWAGPKQSVSDRPQTGIARGLALSLLLAVVIPLAWAVPATIEGGESFAAQIFWTQTAGRIASAFAHQRPYWFYLPLLPFLFLPLLFWPPLWRAVRASTSSHIFRQEAQMRFLLAWIVPTFLALALISAKQLHYLLPLLCPTVILAAGMLDANASRNPHSSDLAWPGALFLLSFAALLGAPFAIHHFSVDYDGLFSASVRAFKPAVTLAFCLVLVTVLYGLRRTQEGQLKALALSSVLLVGCLTFQMSQRAFDYIDFSSLANALEPYRDGDLAFVGNYQGELGYTARLKKPVAPVKVNELPSWFKSHPAGAAVVRYRSSAQLKGYKLLFTAPYKWDANYALVIPDAKERGSSLNGVLPSP
jgi:4-amino-4-deoxy-L-arabinose transferase-like glycosyltransferase